MLFCLWWCFDDHLAVALGNPGLGHVAWWVILLISLVFDSLGGSAARS